MKYHSDGERVRDQYYTSFGRIMVERHAVNEYENTVRIWHEGGEVVAVSNEFMDELTELMEICDHNLTLEYLADDPDYGRKYFRVTEQSK